MKRYILYALSDQDIPEMHVLDSELDADMLIEAMTDAGYHSFDIEKEEDMSITESWETSYD